MNSRRLFVHQVRVLRQMVVLCAMAAPILFSAQNVSAQNGATAPAPPASSGASLPPDPHQYISDVVQHELSAQEHDQTYWRYRYHREDKKYNYDRDVIETKEGQLARTVLWNGQPLTPELVQKDEDRMHRLLTDPADLAKHVKREKDDDERARRLLRAVPDAFKFQYDGEEDGLVRLSFSPNSHYNAPTRELQVFRALSGKAWIDRATNRVARIEGRLFDDVTFGLGLLGRLNKGGTFKVVRQQVSPGHWDFITLDVNMQGHAMIFASINVKQLQSFSDYHRMPDSLTLPQAYEMLHQENGGPASANNPGQTASQPRIKN